MPFITGLNADSYVSTCTLGDPRKQIITDGVTGPLWGNGIVVQELGIRPPPAAPSDEGTRPAGSLTAGVYQFQVRYKRGSDGAVGNGSPIISITVAAGDTGVRLNIPADANLQDGLTIAEVYRSRVDKTTLYADGEVAYSGSLVTYDSIIADGSLGLEIETDNDMPVARPYVVSLWGEATFWGSHTYNVGTVAVTNGSKTVTGTDTVFNKSMEGKSFRPLGDNPFYTIATYVSATEITLAENYEGSTASGLSYTISIDGLVLAYNKVDGKGISRPDAYPANNIDKVNGANNEKAVGIGKTFDTIIPFTNFATYYQNFISANTRTHAQKLMDVGGVSNRLWCNENESGDMIMMVNGFGITRLNGSPGAERDLSGAFISTILDGTHEGIHRNLKHYVANVDKAHMLYYPVKKYLMVFICLITDFNPTPAYPNACVVMDMNINPYGDKAGPSPWMLWTIPTAVSSGLIPDDNGILRPWIGDDLGFYWKMDDTDNYNDGVPSGTATGTITAIDATTLTDSAAAYYITGDGLRGTYLRIYDGNHTLTNELIIQSNTAKALTVTGWTTLPVVGHTYEIGGIVLQRYTKTETYGIPKSTKILNTLSMSFDKAASTRYITVYRFVDKSSTAQKIAGQKIDVSKKSPKTLNVKERGFVNQLMFENTKPNEPITITDWTLSATKGGNK